MIYMDPKLIKNVKRAALDDERTVYEIVEEATRDWMDRRTTMPAQERATRGQE